MTQEETNHALRCERAFLADADAHMLEDFVRDLRAIVWEIEAQGKSGIREYETVRAAAPKVIKALVNYL